MKESIIQSIREFYQRWFTAMEDADVRMLLSLLDEEFYLKGPSQPAIQDKETFRNFLEEFHQNFTETVKWEIDELQVFDSYALVRIKEEVQMISKESGEETEIAGVHFSLLRKNPDGNWLLQTDVSSLNHPIPDK